MAIYSIWGMKGVGKTTLSLNLGEKLSESKSVLLISPQPYSELSAKLGKKIPTEQSLQTAIRSGNLKQSVYKKDELFYILSAPSDHDSFDDGYSSDQVKSMLALAQNTFDVVLIDCPTEMDNLVSAWGMAMSCKVLFCMGGKYEGTLWQQSVKKVVKALHRKTIYLGMEQDAPFDFDFMYNYLEQKPHYRIPHNKQKSYDGMLEKLRTEVIQ